MKISPKAVWAAVAPIIAAIALYLITGDQTYLIGVLLGLVSGGSAAIAPPASGVSQREVAQLAKRHRNRW